MEHEFDIIIRDRLADLSPGGDFINLYCIRGEKSCYYYKIVPKEQSTFYAERKAKLDLELGL